MTPAAETPPVAQDAAAKRPSVKPLMLCVDDEPQVLEGLTLVLRRSFQVHTANGGAEALALLAGGMRPAVIMSDMRMPGMNGAAFLAAARDQSPDAVRLLLTGQADMDSAISAINDGGIFRFLSKPCPPPALLSAALAAAEQHRLITAEKELLEQTLLGSIQALTDILAITSPQLFGRATRVKKLVLDLQEAAGIEPRWQLKAACMLSQIGSVALPPDVATKLATGRGLDARETQMVENARGQSLRLIANIPRLEGVIALLEGSATRWSDLTHATIDPDPTLIRDAQLLRAATAFDARETAGDPAGNAIAAMRAIQGKFDPAAIDAIQVLRLGTVSRPVRQYKLRELVPGMILTEDVHLPNGPLLLSRGHEITPLLLARLGNFGNALNAVTFNIEEARIAPSPTA
jgi:CheY-like chemotaxis protein